VLRKAASGVSVAAARYFVSGLRAFLRFCFLEGLVETDLSQAALVVRGRRASLLPGGTPKRGGTFTVGVITAGSAENMFPGTISVPPDYARQMSLYNYLFYPSTDAASPVPGLALSAEPNADASVWTFHLRPGLLWHDGTPFGANDVAYNFRALWSSATTNYAAAFLAGIVDFKNVRTRDKLAVEVPLLTPAAQFPTLLG
jgi:peptide/nickel transport system substrate-binding protein